MRTSALGVLDGATSPGSRVLGGCCELPDVGPESWGGGLCKSCKHLATLNHWAISSGPWGITLIFFFFLNNFSSLCRNQQSWYSILICSWTWFCTYCMEDFSMFKESIKETDLQFLLLLCPYPLSPSPPLALRVKGSLCVYVLVCRCGCTCLLVWRSEENELWVLTLPFLPCLRKVSHQCAQASRATSSGRIPALPLTLQVHWDSWSSVAVPDIYMSSGDQTRLVRPSSKYLYPLGQCWWPEFNPQYSKWKELWSLHVCCGKFIHTQTQQCKNR